MKTLSDVQPGRSWWWWFKSPTHELRVFHIVRDGSGTLWVDTTYGGRRLDEFNWELLEPVTEPRNQKNEVDRCENPK